MMSFSLSGGVEVVGFISPTDITDEYPVIDPLYGIDGFRNVDTQSDLNTIPNLRRRAGMVVGVNNGSTYYKLNPGPWNGTISDWSLFNTGGGSFTGGTVSGATIFTGGVTANTLNVNGVNITGDTYTTGGTYSNGVIDFQYNNGGGYQVIGLYTGQTSYVNSLTVGIGLSADTTTGNITIINTEPDQVVTISGGTGIVTGGTYPNFTIENSLPDQTVSISGGTNIEITGLYPNFGVNFTGTTGGDYLPLSGGTVSGDTIFTSGLTATTLNVNGVNITGDTYVTGGTYYTGGTIIFDYNTIGGFPVSGLTEDLNNAIAGLAEADEETITLNTSTNKIELKEIVGPASGGTRTFQGDVVISGGTLYSDTISATTYLNLPLDVYVTGGTYSAGTITFTNNSGGTFDVLNLYTGQTSYVNSINTGFGLSANTTTGDVTIINTEPDQVVTISGGTNINVTGSYPNFGVDYTGQTTFNYLPLSGGTITGSLTVTGDTILNELSATTAFVTSTQWTLDFMEALNIQIYSPNNLSIDSKSDLVNTPTITILVNNLPYTYTTLINIGDEILVASDINSVIQFNITNYL